MSDISTEDKIKRVCIAMLRATRPSQDPERLTPAPRGQMGLIPLWELYRPLGEAACETFCDEENKRIAELEAAGRRILPYLKWTISEESPGWHPTMPSAVGAFMAALEQKPEPNDE